MSDVRSTEASIGAEAPPNTTANAIAGAALTVLTATAVPLSPVVGGGLAGYLEAGDTDDGLRAGVLSGGVAAPVLVIVSLLFLLPLVSAVSGTSRPVTVVGLVVLGTVYVLGMSMVGGYLGASLGSDQ